MAADDGEGTAGEAKMERWGRDEPLGGGGGGNKARAHAGDGDTTKPEGNRGEHRFSRDEKNIMGCSGILEGKWSGGATAAGGEEEERRQCATGTEI